MKPSEYCKLIAIKNSTIKPRPRDVNTGMHIKNAPKAVQEAFEHVRTYYPEVTSVRYEDVDGFEQWAYYDADGNAPSFDDTGIDIDLLENGLGAVGTLPVSYRTLGNRRKGNEHDSRRFSKNRY